MVSDDDNLIRSRRNFPINLPEIKRFLLSVKREIARRLYRAGIVPQSEVGLDHATLNEVQFDHFF